MTEGAQNKTVSEKLFETYLNDQGIANFEYEPDIQGTTRHPDYRIRVNENDAFFEVKEFNIPQVTSDVGYFDPYPRLREKINAAVKQFRDLKGRMCSIVFANPSNHPFVVLDSEIIFGAMLGNVGITMPFNPASGAGDESRAAWTFLDGGKMIHHKNHAPVAPQNTTISAICALRVVAEGQRRCSIRIANWERQTGIQRTLDKVWEIYQDAQDTGADSTICRLRLVVCENPYAVAPLTEAFARGPFDERFGMRDGRFTRVFVGAGLEALESEEQAVGIYDRTR